MDREMFTLRGTAYWAKVLGDPVPGYQGKGLFWTIDLSPDNVEEATNILGKDRIKNKDDDRGNFVAFKNAYRSYTTKKGETRWTEAPKVVDANGRPWPSDQKIGNGSKVDVKFERVDYGENQGTYLRAVRILDHKNYEAQEFAPLETDDEYFASANAGLGESTPDFKKDFELGEDDIPF